MDIQTYQRLSTRTMPVKKNDTETLSMLALGIAGEAGEIVELIKKNLYHGEWLDKQEVEKEIGDLIWYISNLATECAISLENVLEANVEKLKKRYPKGFSTEDSIRRVDVK